MQGKVSEIVIYRTKTGAIEFRTDIKKETLWATQAQMADVFGVNSQAITRHLQHIYQEGELDRAATCSKMEQVQDEGGRLVKRRVEVYNLDAIISVGYRINSKTGTEFRQWATRVLHAHIVDGYTLNKRRLSKNYQSFLTAVDRVKELISGDREIDTVSTLEIIKMFAHTWLSLDAYDRGALPQSGATRKDVIMTAGELAEALSELRRTLIDKKEAGPLFGKETSPDVLGSIAGNVFQSFEGQDLYPTIEGKAVYLLYFMVKNHPFTDGNKRSGAFAFVWFLNKTKILDKTRFTPVALTALTLFIAESKPAEKEKMIGLIVMLLKNG